MAIVRGKGKIEVVKAMEDGEGERRMTPAMVKDYNAVGEQSKQEEGVKEETAQSDKQTTKPASEPTQTSIASLHMCPGAFHA